METKSLVQTAVAVLVAVVVFSTVLIPIVSDAQSNVGPITTRTSSGASVGGAGLAFYEVGNETITYSVAAANAPLVINGEEVDYSSSATWGSIVMADTGCIMCRTDSHAIQSAQYGDTESSSTVFVAPFTIEVNGATNTITVTQDSQVVSFEYSEIYCMQKVDDSKSGRLNMVGITEREGSIYINEINDLKTWGVYTTGENDTYYALENGKVTTAIESPSSLDFTLTKVEGTTDIYQLNSLAINVGDESFVPYFCLVPASVEGHESSGASYTLVGIIPILVIVGLILGVVGFAIARRYDL